MKRILMLVTLSFKIAYADGPMPPIPTIWYTNNVVTNGGYLSNAQNVVFMFNTTSNNVRDIWTNYGVVNILYTTNLSLPVSNWMVDSNIQMSDHGMYVGEYPSNTCFFRLQLIK